MNSQILQYDINGAQIGGQWANPYFKTGQNDPKTWTYHSGYLLANATANAYAFPCFIIGNF